jgi:hypothetical protein
MTKGQAVYISGSTGNVPNIALAKADSLTTLPAIGVLLNDIANNAFGQVMKLGLLDSFDTSAFSTGDRLYVDTTTAGALTNVRPVLPNYVQRVGSVLVDGVGNGSVSVSVAPYIGSEETGTNAAVWSGTGILLSGLTASEMVLTDANKKLVSAAVATYPSLTELSYVKGVTSAIQTQIGTKAPLDSPVFTTQVTIPVALTGVVRADSGVLSIDTDVTDIVAAGTVSAAGKLELATDAEMTTGTDTARAITPANAKVELDKKLALACGTMSGNITLGENTSIDLDPAGSADGKYSGICITGTAGAALAFGDLIYLAVADSRWELTDADATATAGTPLIGMCVLAAAGDASATKILLQGVIRADAKFPALTIGAPAYVGETAGAIQTAIPTGADNVIRVVGRALTADELYFCPSQDHQITVA